MGTLKTRLIDQGPALTRFDLYRIEVDIGVPLPNDYAQFLLSNNGGFPEPEIAFAWNGELREVNGFDILWPTPETGVRASLRHLRDLDVDGYLPIAGSWDADICLSFRDNIGHISLVEYIYRNDFKVGATMHHLADSFSEFLDSLVVLPVDPIQEMGKRGTPDDLRKYLCEGKSLDAVGKNKLSILCEAIKYDNLPLIEECIKRKANVSKAIEIATRRCNLEVIQRLVDAGADVNEKDEFGTTPLNYVAGTALPGDEGAKNRAVRDLLVRLGAHK